MILCAYAADMDCAEILHGGAAVDREEILEKGRRENMIRDEGVEMRAIRECIGAWSAFCFCASPCWLTIWREGWTAPARGLPAGLYRLRGLWAVRRKAGEVHACHRNTGRCGRALRAHAVCGQYFVSGARTLEDKLVLRNRLKVARAERGLSQGELAKLVGVSRQTISSIETGQFNPTAKLALILCIAPRQKV